MCWQLPSSEVSLRTGLDCDRHAVESYLPARRPETLSYQVAAVANLLAQMVQTEVGHDAIDRRCRTNTRNVIAQIDVPRKERLLINVLACSSGEPVRWMASRIHGAIVLVAPLFESGSVALLVPDE